MRRPKKKWKAEFKVGVCPGRTMQKCLSRVDISCKQAKQLYRTFYLGEDMLPIYRMVPNMLSFLRFVAVSKGNPISLSFEAWCGVHGRIQRMSTFFLVAFNRYDVLLAGCKIWRLVIFLGLKIMETLYEKLEFKTEIDNLLSNFTCKKTWSMYIECN
jgi:hypothetical protein